MPKATAAKKSFVILLCICIALITSCAAQTKIDLPVLEDYETTAQAEKTDLKWGVVKGPYSDMFKEIVEPLFAEKGYSVEFVTYDNYTDPNFALANGEIDVNMFQHYKYLNSFKFEYNLDLSAIAEIPTAPMGVYAKEYESVDELPEGAVIAIPGDSTNLSRALVILSAAGVITVDPAVDSAKLTLRHITKNPKNVTFVTQEAHLLAGELDACDMAIINGNFAMGSGLSLTDSLYNETLTDHGYINVIAVRTDDVGRQYVMDLIDVLHSDEYVSAIKDENGKFSNFQYPCNFDALSE